MVSKNQARMHIINNMPPYFSSVDAISKFPETATALGVTLDEMNNVVLTAPCGIEDVLNLKVTPTPHFTKSRERVDMYEARLRRKIGKVCGLTLQSIIPKYNESLPQQVHSKKVLLISKKNLFFKQTHFR